MLRGGHGRHRFKRTSGTSDEVTSQTTGLDTELRVLRLDGGQRYMLGDALDHTTAFDDGFGGYDSLGDLFLTFDRDGQPVVAWDYSNGHNDNIEMAVRMWTGSDWRRLASQISNGGNTTGLIIDGDGAPVRSFVTYGDDFAQLFLRVHRWDFNAWIDLGIDIEIDDPRAAQLVTGADGDVVFAWPTETDFVLRAWNGAEWQERAATTDTLSELPSDVRFLVSSDSSTGFDVHLRHFEDGCRRGLSASDRGGGVSNSSAPSLAPYVSSNSKRVCVAYYEYGSGGDRVLLCCHDDINLHRSAAYLLGR